MKDSELIDGCLRGRKKAQDELYRIYAGRLFGVCLRYTRDRMEAEDVLQEGFVKIFKKMDTFKKEKELQLFPWMRRVMVNTMLNYLRDKKKYRFTDELEDIDHKYADGNSGEGLESLFEEVGPDEILKIITDLPDGYRTVFNLYAFEEYGHNEIAEILGISVNTSKTQLMKARKAIISKLRILISLELDIKIIEQ